MLFKPQGCGFFVVLSRGANGAVYFLYMVDITKASGEREPFDRTKLCDSLRMAHAPEDVVAHVCALVEQDIQPGATTSYLFRKATRHLMKANPAVAARYNLKRGIAELGPAGFFFEQFLEVMLKEMGYETERNRIMKGRCVEHEVDVVAHGKDEHYLIEAKYHNSPHLRTHVDVVMYADARLQDISEEPTRKREGVRHGMWLITNTKFTHTAIQYAQCRGLTLTGWRYPKDNGLEDLIAKHVLYPVTALPSVNPYVRHIFAKYDMMLVRDLAVYSEDDLVKKFEIHRPVARGIIREAHALIYGDAV